MSENARKWNYNFQRKIKSGESGVYIQSVIHLFSVLQRIAQNIYIILLFL
jgi:hypothetical protein